jgi:hypothetical protein
MLVAPETTGALTPGAFHHSYPRPRRSPRQAADHQIIHKQLFPRAHVDAFSFIIHSDVFEYKPCSPVERV